MVSQKDVAEQFAAGDTDARASNVEIREVAGGYTLLVGYGHAVYAARSPGGIVVGYSGWHGHSPSTSTQMTKMGASHPDDTSIDARRYRERCIVDQWISDSPQVSEWESKGLIA